MSDNEAAEPDSALVRSVLETLANTTAELVGGQVVGNIADGGLTVILDALPDEDATLYEVEFSIKGTPAPAFKVSTSEQDRWFWADEYINIGEFRKELDSWREDTTYSDLIETLGELEQWLDATKTRNSKQVRVKLLPPEQD